LKIIWGLCFSAATIYCVVWCGEAITVYLQYQTYISTSTVQEIPTTFPAVSICNLKFSNKIKSLNYLNNLLFPNGIPVFNRAQFGNDNVQDYVQFLDYYQQAAISNLYNLKNKTEQRNLGSEMSDMLFSCTFNWATCTANDFSYFFDSFYGNCFTFNSGFKANGSTASYIKAAVPGPIYGLSLTIFLGDPVLQSLYQLYGNGIAIVVHNQTGYPSFGSRRILASAGMETDISINRNFVSKLGGNYGSCLQDISNNSSYVSTSEYFNYIVNTMKVMYDQSLCYLICFQDKVIQGCSCSVGILPDYNGVPACRAFTDMFCMQAIATSFNTAGVSDSCNSKCPAACSYIEYSTRASSVSYPNEYYKLLLMNHSRIIASNISYANLDKSFLKVNIFYETMSFTQTTENAALTFETFISNIGGIFGLFIGISLLSFLEIIDLFVFILLALYNYRKSLKNNVFPLKNIEGSETKNSVD
jgi:hypothetical protein